MVHRRFYTELGRLLYSIAKADGKIQRTERVKFEKLISDELSKSRNVFKDHPGHQNILLSKLSFKAAERENLSISECVNSFNAFFKNFGNHLLAEEKEFAKSIIQKTAVSYKGISTTEKEILESVFITLKGKE